MGYLLLAVGILWIITSVVKSAYGALRDRGELDLIHRQLTQLGLTLDDLPSILARVPHGYIPDKNLYFAARNARRITTSSSALARATAILGLVQALSTYTDAQKRHRLAALTRDAENNRMRAAHEAELKRVRELAEIAGPPSVVELTINETDFVRDNSVDRQFRKQYLLRLIALHENACALCGAHDNGLDLDHFFIPKAMGGNFVLHRRDGVKINNAVPMCETCNRAKGARPWNSIGDATRLRLVLERNVAANQMVNADSATHELLSDVVLISPGNFVPTRDLLADVELVSPGKVAPTSHAPSAPKRRRPPDAR